MRALLLFTSCVALVVAVPAVGHAHAVITSSSIGDAPLAAGQPTQVTLHFNSAIEASHSTVSVVGADGKPTRLELVPGEHEPGTLVIALPALPAGSYALRYRVLAADGHVTENVLRFRVAAAP
jgi:hypothetical protein